MFKKNNAKDKPQEFTPKQGGVIYKIKTEINYQTQLS